MAIKDPSNKGGPRELLSDRGRDFDSFAIQGRTKAEHRARSQFELDMERIAGILNLLQIEPHLANPFSPNSKARQERWYRCIGDFSRTVPTYCGFNAATKPPGLPAILKDRRRIPHSGEIESRLPNFLRGYNESSDHDIEDLVCDGVKLSPSEFYERFADTKTVDADPAAVDAILRGPHALASVTREGVSVRLCGQTFRYGNCMSELDPFRGDSKANRKQVFVVYDPQHMESVDVWDQGWRFICTATANLTGGGKIDKAAMAKAQREKSIYRRSLQNVAKYHLTELLTPFEHARDASIRDRQEQRQAEQEPAETLRIRRTPLDGQGKRIGRERLRTAVGAESMSAPRSAARPCWTC